MYYWFVYGVLMGIATILAVAGSRRRDPQMMHKAVYIFVIAGVLAVGHLLTVV